MKYLYVVSLKIKECKNFFFAKKQRNVCQEKEFFDDIDIDKTCNGRLTEGFFTKKAIFFVSGATHHVDDY